MDLEPTIVQVPAPGRRGPSAIVLATGILVVLAILKPWAGSGSAVPLAVRGSDPPVARPTLAAATPAETPTSQAIWDPDAMACMSSEGNRLLALQRSSDQEVRTWLVLGDTSLSDPLDPGATPLRLPSTHVIGLGICARRIVQEEDVTSAAQILDVEAVAPGGGSARDLGPPCIVTRQLGLPYLGVLYSPPSSLAGGPCDTESGSPRPVAPVASPILAGPATWPLGSYAIGFRFVGDAPSLVRWVRLDILAAVGKYD